MTTLSEKTIDLADQRSHQLNMTKVICRYVFMGFIVLICGTSYCSHKKAEDPTEAQIWEKEAKMWKNRYEKRILGF